MRIFLTYFRIAEIQYVTKKRYGYFVWIYIKILKKKKNPQAYKMSLIQI